MYIVNDYMHLDIKTDAFIEKSYCEVKQDKAYLQIYFGLYAGDCLFDLSQKSYLFSIRIDSAYFEKYNEPMDFFIEKQVICCNIQSKLLEIINCSLDGIQKKVFLEGQILHLLFLIQKNNLSSLTNCNNCSILNSPVDIAKIEAAKQYILSNLSENITIPKIASSVGTNQCYLKKGFKEMYGQTIFEFIQSNRMEKAKYLLQNQMEDITNIAFSIGYSSLSSFSQAYKNYFGISPSDEMKKNISNN